jgi:succinate dehydrogenase / fumarate reductase cytochrome b subunit
MASTTSFLQKNDFLIRRLHSLSGVIPIGAYMVVHLLTNSTILNSAGIFQANVITIHQLGPVLPLVEWLFIFGPIIFHAVVGIYIARTGKNNAGSYQLASNRRYVWQRWTGMLAAVFIFSHVFHLHGWFHNDWWMANIAEPLGMAQFAPYSAASSLAAAMTWSWLVFYAVGVVACSFHLANGIWTSGITWGIWLTPKAQSRATVACGVFGVLIGVVGLSALAGVKTTNIAEARETETEMYETKVRTGEMKADPHKRWEDESDAAGNKAIQPLREVDYVKPTNESSGNTL